MVDVGGATPDEGEGSGVADFCHEADGGEFAFEVADISVDVLGDVFDSFIFDFGAGKFGFGAENGAFVLKLGELNIESATHGETAGETFIDGFDLGGETVAGDDDLFVELIEVIENVEKFFLRFLFADDKLEVVDDEAVELLEFIVEFVTFTFADGFDKVGIKIGDGGVENFVVWVAAE